MINVRTNNQSGAVSLFVVVFAMLIITVITVSFLRLMMDDQRQASNNDLSQSAYDSAQAGVEDAKRALLKYQQDCSSNPGSCDTYGAALTTDKCNAALNGISSSSLPLPNGSYPEIKVQQSLTGDDDILDQAYTCVTITLQTQDYLGELAANESQLVPLFSSKPFDRVRVEWFSKEDLSVTTGPTTVDLPGVVSGTNQPLYEQGEWPSDRPPLLRAQLVQFAHTFTLNNFDVVSGAQSNGATVFLYPTKQTGITDRAFTNYDFRKTSATDDADPKNPINTPLPVTCAENLNSGGYSCATNLVLPQAISATGIGDRTAFLRLAAFYKAAHFRVTLWNGPVDLANPPVDPVKFKDVQPLVDSTGRANDLFRRIQSRVDLYDTSFPYPEGTIDVTGNFCKDFAITDTQYIPGGTSCTP
ncbi:MAG: hypothetical protein WAQ27_00375 [Candidatus Microsaccharimonas sp.]